MGHPTAQPQPWPPSIELTLGDSECSWRRDAQNGQFHKENMGKSWETHEDTVEIFDFVLQMNYQTWMSGEIFCIVCQHFEFADPL